MAVPVFYMIRLIYLNGRLASGSPYMSEKPAEIRIDVSVSLSWVFISLIRGNSLVRIQDQATRIGYFQLSLAIRNIRLILAVLAIMVIESSWC
jgi:hypothetical protein